jgi:type II secretory pathway component PulK
MKSGVALLLVLVSLAFISVISVEIIFSSRVDLRIGRNARDRLQAYYHALSGAKLATLRIVIYRELKNQVNKGSIPKEVVKKEMIDRVWDFSMPPFPIQGVKDKVFESWPGKFFHQIRTEGSKIPINLLDQNIHRLGNNVKPDKALEDAKTKFDEVKQQIVQLIESLKKDEEFDDLYPDLKPDDLINPLIDWVDADDEKTGGGGDESSDYDSREERYYPRNDRIPTLSELVMIRNWTDDLAERVGKHFSVLNLSTLVNPNYISLERIKAYGPSLTREDLMAIEKRRKDQPFSSMADLETFIQSGDEIKNGQDFAFPEDLKKDSTVDEKIFIVEGIGVVGESRRTLKMGVRLEEETSIQDPSKPPDSNKPATLKLPRIVYIEEGM